MVTTGPRTGPPRPPRQPQGGPRHPPPATRGNCGPEQDPGWWQQRPLSVLLGGLCLQTPSSVVAHRRASEPMSGAQAGRPPSSSGSLAPPGEAWDRGMAHFIFSARCSVFSRMAWDSWDTGFSMRLSQITCGDPGVSAAPAPPGGPPLHAPRGSPGCGLLPPRGSGAGSCWPWHPRRGHSCSGPGPEGPGSRAAPSGS